MALDKILAGLLSCSYSVKWVFIVMSLNILLQRFVATVYHHTSSAEAFPLLQLICIKGVRIQTVWQWNSEPVWQVLTSFLCYTGLQTQKGYYTEKTW